MKIDFSAPILTTDGKPMMVDGSDTEQTTLAKIAEGALCFGPDPDHETMSHKQKRWGIFRKIGSGGEVDLTAEEVVVLKRVIANSYNVLIMGRAFDLIEPPPAEEKANGANSATA